tara:strand:+ start:198 stop:326 length:129 start_codon:yes stop_codon:yes gene_type:complete
MPQALIDMASSQIHSLGGLPKTFSALDLQTNNHSTGDDTEFT